MTGGSRVYVTHDDGRLDLSDAARYGEIIPVFRAEVYPDTDGHEARRAALAAQLVLGDFNFRHDYLCLVGSPLWVAACSWYLGRRVGQYSSLRTLRFDRQEQAYYVVELP